MSNDEFESALSRCTPSQARGVNLVHAALRQRREHQLNPNASDHTVGPLRLFITGAGGTGKSFVLRLIREVYERAFDGTLNGRGRVLVCAPTGLAASLLPSGRTYHYALGLRPARSNARRSRQPRGAVIHDSPELVNSLSPDDVRIIQRQLREVRALFLDECSMVSAGALSAISGRLSDLCGTDPTTSPFGGRDVFLFGDLYQLPPVAGTPIVEAALWQTGTGFVELTENMRQANDARWLELLNRCRMGLMTAADRALLATRLIQPYGSAPLPGPDALHLYALRSSVAERHRQVLETLVTRAQAAARAAGRGSHNFIAGVDTLLHIDMQIQIVRQTDGEGGSDGIAAAVSQAIEGGNAHSTDDEVEALDWNVQRTPVTLPLMIGMRVMLISSVAPHERLVNGLCGTVVGLETRDRLHRSNRPWWYHTRATPPVFGPVLTSVDGTRERHTDFPSHVWVAFDDPTAGGALRRQYVTRNDVSVQAVPIASIFFPVTARNGRRFSVRQFPLVLSYAITVHKAQGMTLQRAVIDPRRTFAGGQIYCALSRVSSLEGLTLIDHLPPLSSTAMQPRTDLDNEMSRLRRVNIQPLLAAGLRVPQSTLDTTQPVPPAPQRMHSTTPGAASSTAAATRAEPAPTGFLVPASQAAADVGRTRTVYEVLCGGDIRELIDPLILTGLLRTRPTLAISPATLGGWGALEAYERQYLDWQLMAQAIVSTNPEDFTPRACLVLFESMRRSPPPDSRLRAPIATHQRLLLRLRAVHTGETSVPACPAPPHALPRQQPPPTPSQPHRPQTAPAPPQRPAAIQPRPPQPIAPRTPSARQSSITSRSVDSDIEVIDLTSHHVSSVTPPRSRSAIRLSNMRDLESLQFFFNPLLLCALSFHGEPTPPDMFGWGTAVGWRLAVPNWMHHVAVLTQANPDLNAGQLLAEYRRPPTSSVVEPEWFIPIHAYYVLLHTIETHNATEFQRMCTVAEQLRASSRDVEVLRAIATGRTLASPWHNRAAAPRRRRTRPVTSPERDTGRSQPHAARRSTATVPARAAPPVSRENRANAQVITVRENSDLRRAHPPVPRSEWEGTDVRCTVCQEELSNNANASTQYYRIDCGHWQFHHDCIMQWFQCGSQSCPLCRSVVTHHGPHELVQTLTGRLRRAESGTQPDPLSADLIQTLLQESRSASSSSSSRHSATAASTDVSGSSRSGPAMSFFLVPMILSALRRNGVQRVDEQLFGWGSEREWRQRVPQWDQFASAMASSNAELQGSAGAAFLQRMIASSANDRPYARDVIQERLLLNLERSHPELAVDIDRAGYMLAHTE
jgi:hypothetical protein